MSNSDPTIQSSSRNPSGQTANDATHTKSKKREPDLNQENVEGVQQQAGKKGFIQKLTNLRKASPSTSATHNCISNPTADSYYPPAEFRSLVLEELRRNCLEWDISRVRIVSATFHRHSSGECSVRLDLKGELGRFNDSHVLTLHPPPPAPKVPANKRPQLPKILRTKSAQKADELLSPTSEEVNASDQVNNDPSDTANPDCASPISAQIADPAEPTRLLKSKSSTTRSASSVHRLLCPAKPNSAPHSGDVPASTSSHRYAPTERLTARDGMNVLPNDGSAKPASHDGRNTPPSMHPPNNLSQTYTPTALAQSNRDIATAAQTLDKGFPDTPAPIHFPADPALAKSSDPAHAKANHSITYPHTDGGALAPRGAPTTRPRVNSMVPNSIGSSSDPVIVDYTLVTAPFKHPQTTVKQRVTGVATGAFRIYTRTKANVGPKPRTGCFQITDTCQADKCPSPVQDNTTVQELPMGDAPITLEDVVVLASTITSRASRHTRAVHSENWFLDTMWKGLHLITGSKPAYPDYSEGVDAAITELLDDVMSRFRGKITKFRREISQIREAEDPRGEKRHELQAEMQQQIDRFNKEIDAKIKATDALAKENQELELEMRRLQEGMQSEGKV